MSNVENNEGTTAIDDLNGKRLGGVTGKGFKPGQSGNPGGRPKGTMKQFVQQMFINMSPEEKREWLLNNKVNPVDIWKMGEGLPKADIDLKGEITSKIISVDE